MQKIEEILSKADKKLAKVIAQHGPCDLKPRKNISPYESLVRAIAHQQLHGKAAETILGRFVALYGEFPTPQQILKTKDEKLRAVGFSGAKVLAIKDIATKTISGVVPDLKTAKKLSDIELIERLVTIRGVGQWTVEMFLIFTLGRRDIFPVDDFGVRAGMKHLYKLSDDVKKKELIVMAEKWEPYRSVASWYMWRVADMHKKIK